MATVVLQTVGSIVGTALGGPLGGAIGSTLGATAGYYIDQQLFATHSVSSYEGPRLSELQVQSSTEGSPIPRLYGRARLNGQIIWATDHVEKITQQSQTTGGGKGGGSKSTVEQTTYSYFANFAVGLCEGEIGHIGRVWANGRVIDLDGYTFRIYRGSDDQLPDSLIEAKQGSAFAPAYRGLAYIVFEEFPLAEFGNRIPQLAFEIVKPIAKLERDVKAIAMIPGATEFGYDTQEVKRKDGEGEWQSENRHSFERGTDFSVSLRHLMSVCPNLKRVALVVAWFGDDLRVSQCRIRPRIDFKEKPTEGDEWQVAGVKRSDAMPVSRHQGRAAFGGTPSDASIKRAIKALKERGLEVVLYPFIMMDIPSDNSLPDPYSDKVSQAAFPWRGRITCYPGPAQTATVDKTAEAANQVQTFYDGTDWSYRRFIRHYAQLAAETGGVDAFLIGSEMRGLTWLRDASGAYPFVNHLKSLASEVRMIVGNDCKLTYAADWSEYFGHHPSGEGGTVRFHLDPLWADDAIDIIGIDNYMPLSDWRSGSEHKDQGLSDDGLDLDYLKANIAGGEGYDWYYASDEDRQSQTRTPISDGAYSKPWIYRYKDLVNWWSNPHYDRPDGVEASSPTVWQPRSKPIWFTELGCAAVHLSPNQPNVFPDSKSAEDALPYFSNGGRDDAAQRAFLSAHFDYWSKDDASNNPISEIYNGPMVEPDNILLWAWDARPFPAFPFSLDVWADGEGWHKGHWLNGRLGGAPLGAVFSSILGGYSLTPTTISFIGPVLDGYVIDRPMSARAALEGLADAFGMSMVTDEAGIGFRKEIGRKTDLLDQQALVEVDEGAVLSRQSAAWESLPSSIDFNFSDLMLDYRQSVARREQPSVRARNEQSLSVAGVSSQAVMQPACSDWLRRKSFARHEFGFQLPPSDIAVEVGDRLWLQADDDSHLLLVREIEDGTARQVRASLVPPLSSAPEIVSIRGTHQSLPSISQPVVEVLDLPVLPFADDYPHAPYLAATANPWPGALQLFSGSAELGFTLIQSLDIPAIMGNLVKDLGPGAPYRWDWSQGIEVKLINGDLSSHTKEAVFDGANAAAIRANNGNWEIIQFQTADLIADKTWRLTGLLRGQLGTETANRAGASTNARFVLLNQAITPLKVGADRLERPISLRAVVAGQDLNSSSNSDLSVAMEGRGLNPYAPVHFKIRSDGQQDWELSWIRRARVNADSWTGLDIPLDEPSELYRLRIFNRSTGSLLRSIEVAEPSWFYQLQDRLTDSVSDLNDIKISVSQISRLLGDGQDLIWPQM